MRVPEQPMRQTVILTENEKYLVSKIARTLANDHGFRIGEFDDDKLIFQTADLINKEFVSLKGDIAFNIGFDAIGLSFEGGEFSIVTCMHFIDQVGDIDRIVLESWLEIIIEHLKGEHILFPLYIKNYDKNKKNV